jgi:glycosyltransferase involved in cell wall biosynthesis
MIDESGFYCQKAQSDVEKCQRCIQINGIDNENVLESFYQQLDSSVSNWRLFFKAFLSQAEQVIYPSKSTQRIIKKHYALNNASILPHPEKAIKITFKANKAEQTNIAIIGAIGKHKGYEILVKLAKNALKEGLNIRYIVIGYSSDDQQLKQYDNIVLAGSYQHPNELSDKIKQHQCSLAAFFSVWPETYCYTLTEALENSLYPVAFNLGAIAERVKNLNFGTLLDINLSPMKINKQLLKINQKLKNTNLQSPGNQYLDIKVDYYSTDVSKVSSTKVSSTKARKNV